MEPSEQVALNPSEKEQGSGGFLCPPAQVPDRTRHLEEQPGQATAAGKYALSAGDGHNACALSTAMRRRTGGPQGGVWGSMRKTNTTPENVEPLRTARADLQREYLDCA